MPLSPEPKPWLSSAYVSAPLAARQLRAELAATSHPPLLLVLISILIIMASLLERMNVTPKTRGAGTMAMVSMQAWLYLMFTSFLFMKEDVSETRGGLVEILVTSGITR